VPFSFVLFVCFRLRSGLLNLFPKCVTVCALFAQTYQSIATELYSSQSQPVDGPAVTTAYIRSCEAVMGHIKAMGFGSVTLAASDAEKLLVNPTVRPGVTLTLSLSLSLSFSALIRVVVLFFSSLLPFFIWFVHSVVLLA
jgi:hypothetical protein